MARITVGSLSAWKIAHGRSLRYVDCVKNQQPEASGPIIYGLALSTPAHVVEHLAATLTRYRRRIGTRWRGYDTTTQAILTCAWLEGGHTYRSLGAGNGVPKAPAAPSCRRASSRTGHPRLQARL